MKKDFLLATVFSILTLFPATAQNDLDIWNLPELNVYDAVSYLFKKYEQNKY